MNRTYQWLCVAAILGLTSLMPSFAGEPPGAGDGESHAEAQTPVSQAKGKSSTAGGSKPGKLKPVSDARPVPAKGSRVSQVSGPGQAQQLQVTGASNRKAVNVQEAAREEPVGMIQDKAPLFNDFHRPEASEPFNRASTGTPMMNRAPAQREEPAAKPPAKPGANVAAPGGVRVHPTAAASIGQLTPSSAKTSAAAINGTEVRARP